MTKLVSNHERLRRMLGIAVQARAFCNKRKRRDLDTDELFSLAMVRLVEMIGEQAARVSKGFQVRHPEIPWKALIGQRDRLIRHYYAIDLDIIWRILSKDLAPLIRLVQKVLLAVENSKGENS